MHGNVLETGLSDQCCILTEKETVTFTHTKETT